MSKGKKVTIIVLVVVLVVFLAVGLVFMHFNKDKEMISADEFREVLEDKDYKIHDITKKFEVYDHYMKKAYVAEKDNLFFEFYELFDVDKAINMYKTNEDALIEAKGNSSKEVHKSFKNYETHYVKDHKNYMYISRVGNTIFYVNAPASFADDIDEVIEKLGY